MEAGARTARLRSLTLSPAAFTRFAFAALAALFLIVVSGATVRLTGSGLGCENWPNCGETFLPPKDYNALIEFGNRVAGVIVGLTTLAAAAAAFRVPGLPRWLFWCAVALPFTVLAQGILGGITVILDLHPLIVMGHYLLSLAALAVAVAVVQGARDFDRAAATEAPLGSAWPSSPRPGRSSSRGPWSRPPGPIRAARRSHGSGTSSTRSTSTSARRRSSGSPSSPCLRS